LTGVWAAKHPRGADLKHAMIRVAVGRVQTAIG
jgi:hypothetical protein